MDGRDECPAMTGKSVFVSIRKCGGRSGNLIAGAPSTFDEKQSEAVFPGAGKKAGKFGNRRRVRGLFVRFVRLTLRRLGVREEFSLVQGKKQGSWKVVGG
jgi:hypothetical protein